MAKLPEEHLDIHRAADKREPAMERAVNASGAKLAELVDLDALELAIGTGDVATVMALFPAEAIAGAYESLEELIGKAWLEGGEIGAEDVNDFIEEETPDG